MGVTRQTIGLIGRGNIILVSPLSVHLQMLRKTLDQLFWEEEDENRFFIINY